MDLGNAQAKVTVVEYASVGCPVCAKWQQEVYPAFKAKYIDTGKVHYVFREMLVGPGPEIAVAASGFLVARCAGKDKYFAVNDAIFKNQQQAFEAPRETLLNVAKSVGMTEDSFNKCINDEKAIQALNDRVDRHNRDDHVNSTPTFVINGKAWSPATTRSTRSTRRSRRPAAEASSSSASGRPQASRRSRAASSTSTHTGVAKIAVAARS